MENILFFNNSVRDVSAIAILLKRLKRHELIKISSWVKYLIEKPTSKCTVSVSSNAHF